MEIQNQDKVLIQSVRSKRAFRTMHLPMYVTAVVCSVGFSALYTYLFYRANPDALEEMIDGCFIASFAFFTLCLFGPLAILIHVRNNKWLRRQSIVVTEERLLCICGKKKKLNIPLRVVKRLSVDSEMYEKISFVYAGKKRTVWFIENRQEIFETIVKQKKVLSERAEKEEIK